MSLCNFSHRPTQDVSFGSNSLLLPFLNPKWTIAPYPPPPCTLRRTTHCMAWVGEALFTHVGLTVYSHPSCTATYRECATNVTPTGTRRFGTFRHKGFVLVQDLAGVSFWYMQRDRGVVLVHGRGVFLVQIWGGGSLWLNGVHCCCIERCSRGERALD